ncbi:MAG: putative bifunctional diguanylate cyclase/phosphodiesterase [Burkholderiales bacterium]
MSPILSLTPGNIEEMRQQVVEKFAFLFESQTLTSHFSNNIGELVHNIHAEIESDLSKSMREVEGSSLAESEKNAISSCLQSAVTRCSRLNQTLDLLIGERDRQWHSNGRHLQQIMLEFHKTAEKLVGTLIEKDLLERQSQVLENIILSHEKVSQWKAFVQEILTGFRSIFPFNFFFIAFSEEHGLSLFIYYLGDYSEEVKTSVRKKLSKEMIGKLGLPVDAPLDIEEFQIPVSEKLDASDEIEMIAVSVSIPELETLNLAGLLGVAYGSVQKLSPQEASVIRSILAVMVMVVGSSKVLSKTLAELEYYSTHDPLTGLHNRRYFNEMLEYEIGRSERHNHEFSILMLDLDDFKDVNDAYGHPCGDAVLKLVAEAMNAFVRKGDLVTRIGGDEFAIVLTETGKDNALIVAEKIRTALRKIPFEGTDGKQFHVTTSIGLSTFPIDAKNSSDLMTGVDLGLYRAKEMGKDGTCVLDSIEDHIQANRGTRNYVETLRDALKQDRVIPYYQPIIDCKTGHVFAFETLARLVEPGGETISAGMFIETIERYGLGRELDRAIINKALGALKARISNGNDSSRLFINLSAQEIQGRGVLGFAEQLCGEFNIPPHVIVFEILERDAIGDMTHMRKFLSDLRKKGFSFALDDFGSGYNSFHYLRELHFDYVKLDGAFVRNIFNSKVDYTLVHNLIRLCQGLDILTVAEFVESEEVLNELKSMGVDYAQGYHLGMPLPEMK